MANSSSDSITLRDEPVEMELGSVFGTKSTIPGYNVAGSKVQYSGKTQATCMDINKSEESSETLEEAAFLQTLATIVSFPCRFLRSFFSRHRTQLWQRLPLTSLDFSSC